MVTSGSMGPCNSTSLCVLTLETNAQEVLSRTSIPPHRLPCFSLQLVMGSLQKLIVHALLFWFRTPNARCIANTSAKGARSAPPTVFFEAGVRFGRKASTKTQRADHVAASRTGRLFIQLKPACWRRRLLTAARSISPHAGGHRDTSRGRFVAVSWSD